MRPSSPLIALGLLVVGACGENGRASDASDEAWPTVASPWALRDVQGRQLELFVAMGADDTCERFDTIEVEESPRAVNLTALVRVRNDFADGSGCTDAAEFHRVSVTLAEPLGERALTGCMAGEGTRPDILIRSTCAEIAEEGV